MQKFKNTAERNREIKKVLTKKYGKGISVKGGTGTAYGWVNVEVPRSLEEKVNEVEALIEKEFAEELGYYYADDGFDTKRSELLVTVERYVKENI